MTEQHSADLWQPRNMRGQRPDTLDQVGFSSVAAWRKSCRRSVRSRGEAMGRRGFIALLAVFPLLFVREGEQPKPGLELSGKRAMFVTRIRGS
jgi:hypothetical protein